jgi:CRISPR/Cas system endoribonuclease Cas6 (RAMP superfamily)
MPARVGLRTFAQHPSRQAAVRAPLRQFIRRQQTTAAAPAVEGAPSQSLLRRLWTSEVGVKTVHFWYVQLGRDTLSTMLGKQTAYKIYGIEIQVADCFSTGHP